MRFNDLLRTVLANAGEGASAAITRWRQCVDLLAQYDVSGATSKPSISDQERNVVLSIIEEMRPQVALEQRIASIVELGSRLRSPALVRLLSQDHPSLVVAMMEVSRLTGEDWARIIPDLGPLARSVLRRRSDLAPIAQMALRQFGEIDMSLPTQGDADDHEEAEVEASEPVAPKERQRVPLYDNSSQIARLVERIERFKQIRGDVDAATSTPLPDPLTPSVENDASGPAVPDAAPAQFMFETDSAGLVQVIDGAPRAALRGLSISAPSLDNRFGVDGTTLGAFRHRAAFENARLILPDGLLAGEWRMDGEPHFDRISGRFLGYTGSARREQRYEQPVRSTAEAIQPEWNGLSAASMRQLIHELRTPLNAVQGYSEMIEAQILGPVPEAYRSMARSILEDARALIDTFDDLDIASRIVRGDVPQGSDSVDLVLAVRKVLASLDGDTGQVDLSVEQSVPLILGHGAHVERMLSHLMRAGIAALESQERLGIEIRNSAGRTAVTLTMTRPEGLRSIDEGKLLDGRYLIDDKLRGEGPALGLAFTLRLVLGIAQYLGGSFSITEETFRLRLNAMPVSGAGQENNA